MKANCFDFTEFANLKSRKLAQVVFRVVWIPKEVNRIVGAWKNVSLICYGGSEGKYIKKESEESDQLQQQQAFHRACIAYESSQNQRKDLPPFGEASLGEGS